MPLLNFTKLKQFTYYLSIIFVTVLTLACASNEPVAEPPQPKQTPTVKTLSNEELAILEIIKDAEKAIEANETLIDKTYNTDNNLVAAILIEKLDGDKHFLERKRDSLPVELQEVQQKLQEVRDKWRKMIPNLEKLDTLAPQDSKEAVTVARLNEEISKIGHSLHDDLLKAKEMVQTLKQTISTKK